MNTRIVGDVSELPTFDFGSRNLFWWGTWGFMLIEAMGFVLAIGAYLYLYGRAPEWPPGGTPPPDLLWGTLFTVVLLLSLIPNLWTYKVAHRFDARKAKLGVAIMVVIATGLLVLRAFEFPNLNCRWDHNAYGSIVWALMLLHTTHLITDWADTLGLGYFMRKDMDGERFVDVADNANYWNFVVLTWLPIYAMVYWAPRLLP